jgi:membrane protein implicated in regulation of membrane protease activity
MDPMFFFYLTAGAVLFLVISIILGQGHHAGPGDSLGDGIDQGHALGHTADSAHGHMHDGGANGYTGAENLSIWSFQMLFLFIGGFGIGGYFAALSGLGFLLTMFFAACGGLALGSIGYFIINFFYRSQYASNVDSYKYIGVTGIVVTSIGAGGVGQVRCETGTNRETFLARSADGGTIPINSIVRITDMVGSTAIVEIVDQIR